MGKENNSVLNLSFVLNFRILGFVISFFFQFLEMINFFFFENVGRRYLKKCLKFLLGLLVSFLVCCSKA